MIVATDPEIGVCCTTAGGEEGETGGRAIMIREQPRVVYV